MKTTKKGVPLTRCSETKTESQFFGWIRSHARRLSIMWKPKNDYLLTVRRKYTGKNKRTKFEYQCQICKKWVTRKEYEVDHIIPCGSLTCFSDIGIFYEKLLCEVDGYRGLCKSCHLEITNCDRGKR